jgi:hypothetical protein
MAAKLGTGDVSFRLGDVTPTAVYLGSQEVWSAAVQESATLYFSGPDLGEWTDVGNWWLDAELTEPAGRLPTSDESVVAYTNVKVSGQTVVNFTMDAGDGLSGGLNGGSLTVTGVATFGENTGNDIFSINGNAIFNQGSINFGGVNGSATFNGNAANNGFITGEATFNDSSTNNEEVDGNATFNDSSSNNGFVTGTVTCNTTGTCTPT